MRETLEFVALLSTGLFTGAAAYITLVEHPARMSCGTLLAATEFVPSYRRAAVMQASLASLATIAGAGAYLAGSSVGWFLGALLIGAIIPFSIFVILPANKLLLDANLDKNSEAARLLLDKWGRLHAVRTVLSAAAFLLFASLSL